MHYVVVATTKGKDIAVFKLDSEGEWLRQYDKQGYYPDWVRIEYSTCPHCQHKANGELLCRAALGVYHMVNSFRDIRSIEKVGMTTVMSSGHVTMRTETAQEGLAVLFMSTLAFSGCSRFKAFAWSWDYYRRVMDDKSMFYVFFSSFLARAFFERMDMEQNIVAEQFVNEFSEIHQTLVHLVDRIRLASKEDANLNGMISIISLTNLFKGDVDRYIRYFRKKIRESEDRG